MTNWLWLKHLAEALHQGYRFRFNHVNNHKSYDEIVSLPPPPILDEGLTKIVQVMSEEYRSEDPVIAYRQYFIARKFHCAKWTRREVPKCFQELNSA